MTGHRETSNHPLVASLILGVIRPNVYGIDFSDLLPEVHLNRALRAWGESRFEPHARRPLGRAAELNGAAVPPPVSLICRTQVRGSLNREFGVARVRDTRVGYGSDVDCVVGSDWQEER